MIRLPAVAEAWWSGRTARERQMLVVMAALLSATVVWLGVVRPVLAWRAEAATRAEVSAVMLAEVRGAVRQLRPARSAAAPPAGGLEPLVRRTAEAAGLELVTVMSPSGKLGLQLSNVGSGPLFAWLVVLETDHGLSICTLGVTENADATLNVEGSVSAGSCAV